jgi:hypothetical protein
MWPIIVAGLITSLALFSATVKVQYGFMPLPAVQCNIFQLGLLSLIGLLYVQPVLP